MSSRSQTKIINASVSYLALSALVIGFTLFLNKLSGISFEQHTILSLVTLSSFLFSLHLVFGLYIYPTSFHQSGSNAIPPASKIQRSIIGLLVGTVLFYIISILYGAPLTRTFFRTLFFANLLSSMTAVPTSILLGCDPQAWKNMFFSPIHNSIYETCCTITVVFSLLGAWIGGFAIPLDWDRPWQVWPISCMYGSLVGHVIGLLICSVYAIFYKEKSNIM
ncbi:hypothetical protein SAMD00019534_022590 [Acytostelium subglobosum LB1]|uniref:hypothetical protein n=1 Tax=Acytostelium subglobosum LB1 TaxID=1410327 RepID=UPI000644C946|nr:hypothetical protein SAMD00019534_022590 [Acytostelium subglobosum LB1]GAM19084.1 hypothetical protein SAMD00019534_022590 [Acytostelium subglobosum LB1]|eukprot:XP_012757011.1 hypothetical protein SAMD00019534_022590 [Acytostelium subglobosum LB1]